MPPLRFETYQPNASRYAPRISPQEWDAHRQFLTQLHSDHVPRNRMLDELHSIGFYPTYGQLVTKMEEWGLMVYRKRGKRGAANNNNAASEEGTPRASDTASFTTNTPASMATPASTSISTPPSAATPQSHYYYNNNNNSASTPHANPDESNYRGLGSGIDPNTQQSQQYQQQQHNQIQQQLPIIQRKDEDDDDEEFIPYAVIESLVMSPGKSVTSSVPSLNHYSSPGDTTNSTSWPTPRQPEAMLYASGTESVSMGSPYSVPTPATTSTIRESNNGNTIGNTLSSSASGLPAQSFRANLTNPFDPFNTEQFIQQFCDISDINARNPKCQDFLFAGGHFSTLYDLYLSTLDEESTNNAFYSITWTSGDMQTSAGSLRHVWAIINCVLSASTREEVRNLEFVLQKTRMYYAKLVSRSKVKNDLARIIYRGLQDVHKRCGNTNPVTLDDYEGRSQYHSLQQLLLLCRCMESLPSKRSTTVPFEIKNDKMFDDYLPRILTWSRQVIFEDQYEHLKDLSGDDVTQTGRLAHVEKLVASCLIARWAEQPRPLDSSWQVENVAGREVELTKLRRRKHLQTAAIGWRPLDVFMTIASAVVRETCYALHDLSDDDRAKIPYTSVAELFSKNVVFEFDASKINKHEYVGSPEQAQWREIHRKIKEAYGSCNHKSSPRNEAITETCDCSSPVNLISLESHITEFDAPQQHNRGGTTTATSGNNNEADLTSPAPSNAPDNASDMLLAHDNPDRFSLRSISNASSNYRSFRRMASRVNAIHRNGLTSASIRSHKSTGGGGGSGGGGATGGGGVPGTPGGGVSSGWAGGDTYRSSGTFSSLNRMSIASRDSWMLQTFLQIEEDIVEDMSVDMDMMDLK